MKTARFIHEVTLTPSTSTVDECEFKFSLPCSRPDVPPHSGMGERKHMVSSQKYPHQSPGLPVTWSQMPASSLPHLPFHTGGGIISALHILCHEIKGLVRALGKGLMFKTLFKGGFGPPCHFKCQARPMTFLAVPFNASDRPFLRRGSKGSMNPS